MQPQASRSGPLSGAALFGMVFLPFALGHYLSTLMRTVNAILVPELVAELALTPGQLGLLSSVFFFAFALAQLPVGIALDRYGPRLVQLPMLILAACGAMAFAGGREFAQLLCARAVIGFGLGGCFMASVKALATWVAPARLPSLHGCLIAVGGLGAVSATLPVRLLLHYTDWRGLFLLLAAAALSVGLLIYTLSPRTALAPVRLAFKPEQLLQLVRLPAFRQTVGLLLVPHTVFFGLQGLWLGRWLSDAAHYGEDGVAYLLYLSMVGVIVGAVMVGMLTEWASRRGVQALDVAAIGVSLFLLVQLGLLFNVDGSQRWLAVLFTLVGTITGMDYLIVAQAMPAALTGRAATCLNLLIFLGAFLVQAGFGLVLGCWVPNALQQYPVAAYRGALALLLLLQLPGLACFAWRRLRQIDWMPARRA